jgi:hypothetical protein
MGARWSIDVQALIPRHLRHVSMLTFFVARVRVPLQHPSVAFECIMLAFTTTAYDQLMCMSLHLKYRSRFITIRNSSSDVDATRMHVWG